MWQLIIGGFVAAVPGMVWVALKALGFGLITYGTLTVVVDQLSGVVMSNMNGLPVDMLAILRLGGLTTAINIVIASYVSAASIKASRAAFGVIGGAVAGGGA